MSPVEVVEWDAFPKKISELHSHLGSTASKLLFRGQPNSAFSLSTTLERAGFEGMPLGSYHRLIARITPAIETFTGVQWKGGEYSLEIEDAYRQDLELIISREFPEIELYRYLVYLRHHGFPSPLLDWSYSPYVAAFFAFRNPPGDAQSVSIFAYCEPPEGIKGGAVGEPSISALGPYVRSHRRHFRQQSSYTICTSFEKMGWVYYSHQKAFENRRPKQDYLWRFDLPVAERTKALRTLDEYNLNAFSLFDSEESLVETMWSREEVFKVK